jgi:hypothetical protein
MLKKMSIALMSAFLAAVAFTGLVSAQSGGIGKFAPDRDPNHRRLIGQVTAITTDAFTVEAHNGETHTITVTDETGFKSRPGEDPDAKASFEDLVIGGWVAVLNREDSGGGFSAWLVILLPEDFDPEDYNAKRVLGEITSVSAAGGFFEMETRNGEDLTFSVDENTRFAGGVEKLEDLETGMKLGVLALEQEDGTWLAKAVATQREEGPRLDKFSGTLESISGETLIVTRGESSESFLVTLSTRYASRDGEVQGLEDLEIGMVLTVVFDPSTDPFEAKAVLAPDEAILSLERTGGEVTTVSTDSLTIDADGVSLTFSVDENTRIRGRGVNELSDLSAGMRVILLYEELPDGSLLAKAILCGPRPEGGPRP